VLLILFSIVASLIIAFSFASLGIAMLPSWAFYPGVILMLVGIAFRQWSIFVLGRFFSPAVRTQRDQTVAETGPYRYIRHPSYTGALMIFVGLGLALQSWLLFAIAYGYRIHIEEQALTSQLGDACVTYSRRTKRPIPYLF